MVFSLLVLLYKNRETEKGGGSYPEAPTHHEHERWHEIQMGQNLHEKQERQTTKMAEVEAKPKETKRLQKHHGRRY